MTIIKDKGRAGQTIHRFENGYGASVISDGYGSEDGLFELAVIEWDGDTFYLTYETPITSDVLGHLTPEEVTKTLAEIEALSFIDIIAESKRRANAEIAELYRQIDALNERIANLEEN